VASDKERGKEKEFSGLLLVAANVKNHGTRPWHPIRRARGRRCSSFAFL
jgi:hypothetical protein